MFLSVMYLTNEFRFFFFLKAPADLISDLWSPLSEPYVLSPTRWN